MFEWYAGGMKFLLIALFPLSVMGAERKVIPPATRPVEKINRVLVISVDGLRPDLLVRADTPNVRGLIKNGSFTLWAKTTAVSRTLPSHISMLTGVPPHQHEIEWNRDLPLKAPIFPEGRTLFDIAKQHGYSTAIAAGKSKFDTFERPGSVDWSWIVRPTPKPPTTAPAGTDAPEPDKEWLDDQAKSSKTSLADGEVAGHAARLIREHRPQVMLVHFPNVDYIGHTIGWGTREQIQAVEKADAAVGQVLWALDEAAVRNATLVILTADHGGAGITHGPDDARSRHIPWIASGPGIRSGFDLTRIPGLEVNTEDTFATACYVLGIKPSPRVTGKAVTDIVQRDELLRVRE